MRLNFKKWHSITLLCLGLVGSCAASEVALVYENEAAATQGDFTIASVVPEGVLVSAKLVLKAGSQLLVGPVGNSIYHANLVRLDNELDLAVIRIGDPVLNDAAQNMHQKKSKAVIGFLPQAAAATTPAGAGVSSGSPSIVGEPLVLKIDGKFLDSTPIQLKTNSLRKSKFKLEVVVLSTTSVWAFSLDLKSDPKLSFWKDGRATTLNDVPRPNFNYDHQALFTPLKEGRSVIIPVEAHYVDKEKAYIWIITLKTKQGSITQTVNVTFQ